MIYGIKSSQPLFSKGVQGRRDIAINQFFNWAKCLPTMIKVKGYEHYFGGKSGAERSKS